MNGTVALNGGYVQSLASVALTSPWWVGAVAASVGVPVLVHLLGRRSGRRVVFPTVRFVQEAAADRSRWLRLRHAVLLAMRALILTLVAVAFARPVWHAGAAPTPHHGGMAVALVLDRSASMSRADRGASLFEEARRRVVRALGSLDPTRDMATVVLLDGAPGPLLPEPTANLTGLIERTQRVQPTSDRGDLDAALTVAVRELARRTGGGRTTDVHSRGERVQRIELYSDMQTTQWTATAADKLARWAGQWRVQRVGRGDRNIAVFDPVVQPIHPVVGQPAVVGVKVADYRGEADQDAGANKPRTLTLTLTHEGRARAKTVQSRAGSVQTLWWTIHPTQPGPVRIGCDLTGPVDDPLRVDDHTGVMVEVVRTRRVALVSDADPRDPRTALYYFVRALLPGLDIGALGVETSSPDTSAGAGGGERGGERGGEESAAVHLSLWRSDQVSGRLSGVPVPGVPGVPGAERQANLVVVESRGLDTAALEAIHRYIAQGGAVLWVVDSPEAVKTLARFVQRDPVLRGDWIMPAQGSAWVTGADAGLTVGSFQDPLLRVFEGAARAVLMGTRFDAVMKAAVTPPTGVLLGINEDWPLLAGCWVSRGRLAVFAADLAPGRSDLVKGPAFVPLLHELIKGLSPGVASQPNPHPGDQPVVVLTGDQTVGPVIGTGPSGDKIGLSAVTGNGDQTVVGFDEVRQPGWHELVRGEDEGLLGGVYVELDPGESDLHAGEDGLPGRVVGGTEGTGGTGGGARGSDSDPAGMRTRLRPKGMALWPYLAAAAMLGLVVEPWVAGWVSSND